MKVEKRAIRNVLRAQRKALAPHVVAAAGRAVKQRVLGLPIYGEASAVLAYVADENEIPTSELIAAMAEAGMAVYLPTLRPPLGFVPWNPGQRLVKTASGVMEPAVGTPEQPTTPALALVPVVAWDQDGTRLGRGGGFYDRALAALGSGVVRIGLAFEFQEYSGLPRDAWDVPLDFVITERRVVRCSTPRSGLALQRGGVDI